MRLLALVALVVLGCGSVTADPKDGAAGGSGGQPAAGGAAGDVHEQTGGAGGELGGSGGQLGTGGAGVDAGLATTGPCAGLCSNPISLTLTTPHVPLVIADKPGACYAITISSAGYEPSGSCSPGTMAIEVNGLVVACNGGTLAGLRPDTECVVFLPDAPSAGTLTLQ